MLKRLDNSARIGYLLFALIFIIMLAANILSPAVSDDFTYMYSYAEGRERIESVGDILVSLKAHGEYMNGRYTAHFFAHLFLMLPPILFDIVNSLVFTLQIFIIYRLSCTGKGRRNLLVLLIFALLWLAQSKFGQVNLWLDGSCNYLFSVVFGLCFITPYVQYFLYGRELHPAIYLPFLAVSFMSGNSMENIAPAFIMMAALFIVAARVLSHKRVRVIQVLGVLASLVGFVVMMTAPGEWLNKATDGEAKTLLTTLLTALGILLSLTVPIAIYLFLLIRARREKVDRAAIVTSLIFVSGALASNFIMVFALYYPLRSSIACTTLIIAAIAMLYPRVSSLSFGKHTRSFAVLFYSAAALALIVGFIDIGITYRKVKDNEDYIVECRESGILDIEIPDIKPYTKYSELYGLVYVDTEERGNWPNWVMTKYFEVDSIIGRSE